MIIFIISCVKNERQSINLANKRLIDKEMKKISLVKIALFHKTYYQLTKITKKVRKTKKESSFNPSTYQWLNANR